MAYKPSFSIMLRETILAQLPPFIIKEQTLSLTVHLV